MEIRGSPNSDPHQLLDPQEASGTLASMTQTLAGLQDQGVWFPANEDGEVLVNANYNSELGNDLQFTIEGVTPSGEYHNLNVQFMPKFNGTQRFFHKSIN